MGITRRKEAQAAMAIDKAAYIGMEIEHSNDTAGVIREENQKLIDVESIQRFSRH